MAQARTALRPGHLLQAFGVYGAMLGFASAIGLVLGGVLTEANVFGRGWRTVKSPARGLRFTWNG